MPRNKPNNVIYLSERRKHTRELFLTTVDYDVKGQSFKGFIQDISAYGVFIQTARKFKVGQEITVKLPLPNNKKFFKCKGKIIRITPDGIGMRLQSVVDHPARHIV